MNFYFYVTTVSYIPIQYGFCNSRFWQAIEFYEPQTMIKPKICPLIFTHVINIQLFSISWSFIYLLNIEISSISQFRLQFFQGFSLLSVTTWSQTQHFIQSILEKCKLNSSGEEGNTPLTNQVVQSNHQCFFVFGQFSNRFCTAYLWNKDLDFVKKKIQTNRVRKL